MVQAGMSARHQGRRELSGVTVEKSGFPSGTGAKEAYNDTRGKRRRVRRRTERRGSHLSPGHGAPMERGRTAGLLLDAKLAVGRNNGRFVRCSTGIRLREVGAVQPSG